MLIQNKGSSDKLFYSDCFDEISALNNQLVNMQRELNKKNIELEKANELKNQFLGMVVHDLRNPLSAVLTLSKFLIDDYMGEIGDKQLRFIQSIKSSTEEMLDMVDQLLEISEIELGKLNLKKEAMDVVSVIENCISVNRILSGDKQITIDSLYEEGLPPIVADRNKLNQMLNNLISNAVKFSHRNSIVTIHAAKEGESIVISVIDNGIGIHEHEIGRLFKPFGRTSGKGTAGEKSSGLGLAICQKIIEGHGGKIVVDSKYGKGSRFMVYLPLHNDLQVMA